MRRHPRISARLLRRFRLASSEARAVEYHHERYDGTGYYNVDPSEIPLAAHFLIVADTFDAMTSDRPYRAGLPRDVALAEIEAGAGTQFHPAVAKAFVALERGVDPLAVLTPAETAGLRRLSLSRVSTPSHVVLWVDRHPEVLVSLGLAGALAAIALGRPWLALGALLAAVAITAWWQVQRVRARLLADDLRRALAEAPGQDPAFAEFTGRLARVSPLSWAGLVAWQERDLAGSIAREWGDRATRPTETALTSWLIREAEAAEDVATAPGSDIGTVGHTLCVPLRRDGCGPVGVRRLRLRPAAAPARRARAAGLRRRPRRIAGRARRTGGKPRADRGTWRPWARCSCSPASCSASSSPSCSAGSRRRCSSSGCASPG